MKFGNTLRTIYFGSPHTSRSDMFYLHFERRNRKRSIQSEKYVSKISGKDENKPWSHVENEISLFFF